ncbi:hypothetical protein CDAR_208331 [Caerostris darwini]|uniref:Uncharacterized protein n=1 Tax=Caerostris darwini TaxID=1538125 RepID=A0AAV4RFP9_9ARAC|nr:hypothetical protein CDAR_208331 [Caerostris darwini]
MGSFLFHTFVFFGILSGFLIRYSAHSSSGYNAWRRNQGKISALFVILSTMWHLYSIRGAPREPFMANLPPPTLRARRNNSLEWRAEGGAGHPYSGGRAA